MPTRRTDAPAMVGESHVHRKVAIRIRGGLSIHRVERIHRCAPVVQQTVSSGILRTAVHVIGLFARVLFLFVAEVTAGYFIASLTGLYLHFQKKPIVCSDLFSMISLAGFLKTLLVPWALIAAVFPNLGLSDIGFFWLGAVVLLQICYLTRELKRLGNLSVDRAFLAWMMGIWPVFLLLGIVFIFGVWGLVWLFE